jgi:hypothetical protein
MFSFENRCVSSTRFVVFKWGFLIYLRRKNHDRTIEIAGDDAAGFQWYLVRVELFPFSGIRLLHGRGDWWKLTPGSSCRSRGTPRVVFCCCSRQSRRRRCTRCCRRGRSNRCCRYSWLASGSSAAPSRSPWLPEISLSTTKWRYDAVSFRIRLRKHQSAELYPMTRAWAGSGIRRQLMKWYYSYCGGVDYYRAAK